MLSENIARIIAAQNTGSLQRVRRAIEAELLRACADGESGTQAHAGKMEMLGAIGAELDRRNALIPPPPFVDTCVESVADDAVRLSFQVRVF